MNKNLLAVFGFFAVNYALAAPITEQRVPKTAAPYGAYYVNSTNMSSTEAHARSDAVANHYGFQNSFEATKACMTLNRALPAGGKFDCAQDPFAHLRDKDAATELQKYGFGTWVEAVEKCEKNYERGDVLFCRVDPFLRLRMRSK